MIGERLAELRKLNGDTQQALADKLSLSVWSIRAWEQGKASRSAMCCLPSASSTAPPPTTCWV